MAPPNLKIIIKTHWTPMLFIWSLSLTLPSVFTTSASNKRFHWLLINEASVVTLLHVYKSYTVHFDGLSMNIVKNVSYIRLLLPIAVNPSADWVFNSTVVNVYMCCPTSKKDCAVYE